MSPPRSDDEKNEMRHAATSEEACTNMEEKYGWQLKNKLLAKKIYVTIKGFEF